jgi:hypothetical protein
MRKSEKLLLAGTIGLGLLLAVTQLPGKGHQRRAPEVPAPQPPADNGVGKALPPPATLELLATHRVELKPLAPGTRNPFRPLANGASGGEGTGPTARGTAWEIGMEKVSELKLTGILDERTRLAALINGKPVRAGDHVGDLTVVRVTEHGVVLEYQGQRFFKKLFERLGEPSAPGKGPPADESEDTHWPSDDAAPGADAVPGADDGGSDEVHND